MNYGCDVSNRYTGYLDSSDHGNSMSSATRKNKRKIKKKRKPKNQPLKVENESNTTENAEIKAIDDAPELQQHPTIDDKEERNDENESIHEETLANSIDGLSSLPSCGSPMPLDTSKEAMEYDDNKNASNGMIIDGVETKWSVICFEEEKNLMSQEEKDNQRVLNEPEMSFKEQRIYPTMYFYNSKYGNRHRRVVFNDYHDQNARLRNDIAESNSTTNDGKQKKRPKRYVRNRRKNTLNDKNDSGNADSNEVHSTDEKQNDSYNESVDCASQPADEPNNREHSKNHYNKFKHGMPQRTFSRRRTDFVRNV